MRLQRHRQEVKVRGVAKQILMDAEVFIQHAVSADPHLTNRIGHMALQRVMELNRADLQRLVAEELLFHAGGQQVREIAGDLRFRFERVRRGRGGHRFLMLVARLGGLERGSHIENRLAVLHRCHAAGAKAVAVTQHFHIINNRFLAIAGAQKVAVERVHQAVCRNGLFRRIERLPNDLAAKDLAQT